MIALCLRLGKPLARANGPKGDEALAAIHLIDVYALVTIIGCGLLGAKKW
jgi:hypothetical protein